MTKALKRDEESYQRFHAYIVEVHLESEMRDICIRHRVSIHDIYLDERGPSTHAARLEVWWWLVSVIQKSPREVGRIFHRDGSSILYALRRLHERANAMVTELESDTVSHVAKQVAQTSAAAKASNGFSRAAQVDLGNAVGSGRKR